MDIYTIGQLSSVVVSAKTISAPPGSPINIVGDGGVIIGSPLVVGMGATLSGTNGGTSIARVDLQTSGTGAANIYALSLPIGSATCAATVEISVVGASTGTTLGLTASYACGNIGNVPTVTSISLLPQTLTSVISATPGAKGTNVVNFALLPPSATQTNWGITFRVTSVSI